MASKAGNRPLNDRQMRFIQEYLVDLNATQAAIRAGYSEHTARIQASKLLAKPNIHEMIREQQAIHAENVGYTAEKLLRDCVDVLEAVKPRATAEDAEPALVSAFKGIADTVGKHIDIQAWRERVDMNVTTDHAELMEKAMQRAEEATRKRVH